MTLFFLIIIYLSFISLGLPDSLLGAAWPLIHLDLAVSLPSAGIISMIITGGTIVSSFLSGKLIRRFGTGKVTFVSVSMTAVALLGFFAFPSFLGLCLSAIPLGLGAGAVDAALNNFVALHYQSKHMSWLHCFWGVGATVGPMIMSFFIAHNNAWRKGYLAISMIQFCLVAILFATLPLWKTVEKKDETAAEAPKKNLENPFEIRGVKIALLSFFSYCAIEATAGLWGSSYLVGHKGVSADMGARWTSMFYAGITVGRFLSGFVAIKLSNRSLIRIGQSICASGAILLLLPLPLLFSMIGFVMVGLGCAPVFPCMLQETPRRFGASASQSIMGIQMAFAYMGSTFMPPLFGMLTSQFGIAILPVFLSSAIVLMVLSSESLNKILSAKASRFGVLG